MRPNAKNSGAVTGTASRGCGTVPRLGTSVTRDAPGSIGLPSDWFASQTASCAAAASRDMPVFSRPMMSRLRSVRRPQGSGEPDGASRAPNSRRMRRPQSAKFLRHDADDLEWEPIEEQAAAEHRRVARKQPVPSAVAEDDNGLSGEWPVVGRRERATHRRIDAEYWKKLPVTNVPKIKRRPRGCQLRHLRTDVAEEVGLSTERVEPSRVKPTGSPTACGRSTAKISCTSGTASNRNSSALNTVKAAATRPSPSATVNTIVKATRGARLKVRSA